jgi:hypothetical protein
MDSAAFVYMGVCILIVMNKSGLLLLLLLHLMLRVFYVLVDGFWCLGVMLEHETPTLTPLHRSLRFDELYIPLFLSQVGTYLYLCTCT